MNSQQLLLRSINNTSLSKISNYKCGCYRQLMILKLIKITKITKCQAAKILNKGNCLIVRLIKVKNL